MSESDKKLFPPQHQNHQPGIESEMNPFPIFKKEESVGCGKLKNKTAIITGGDSGIGRAVAVAFAQEGADISIVYLNEHEDAKYTKKQVEENGRKCILISGDVGNEDFCIDAVKKTVKQFSHLDILVNNAGEIHSEKNIENITKQQLEKTFRTNVFSMFYMTKAAIKYLKSGSSIINTASVTAYHSSASLLDYSSSKGAVVSFTRALSGNLITKGIRVNGVAPGPIWTPFIPSYLPEEEIPYFGSDTPMERAGQPVEVASCFVFLASDDASYISGQILHPNGGEIVNG
jgi:NAD(P)-dependent dehydrogenase (short-subunit alcohol dehydrogenase family)